MSTDQTPYDKPKKERSPSFPFIPLEKALQRAKAMEERHKRDPARLTVVGTTWGYAAKSSGLLQTAAALIQFGLIENVGSGADRKIQLTDLARRILFDTRDGVRERGLKEAALKPRIMTECFDKWGTERPSDDHCVSYLIFDRGFSDSSARLFLKTYDDTVAFSNLTHNDVTGTNLSAETSAQAPTTQSAGGSLPKRASYSWARPSAPSPAFRRSTVTLVDGSAVSIEIPETISKAGLEGLKMWLDFMYRIAEGTAVENERKAAEAAQTTAS